MTSPLRKHTCVTWRNDSTSVFSHQPRLLITYLLWKQGSWTQKE